MISVLPKSPMAQERKYRLGLADDVSIGTLRNVFSELRLPKRRKKTEKHMESEFATWWRVEIQIKQRKEDRYSGGIWAVVDRIVPGRLADEAM